MNNTILMYYHPPSLHGCRYQYHHNDDYVVYDVQAYRFQTILDLLYRGSVRYQVQLGTYSQESHCLITHKEVWK